MKGKIKGEDLIFWFVNSLQLQILELRYDMPSYHIWTWGEFEFLLEVLTHLLDKSHGLWVMDYGSWIRLNSPNNITLGLLIVGLGWLWVAKFLSLT